MGLFSKKLCPICGEKVKRLTGIIIKDKQKLCEECTIKVNMDPSMIPYQTVDSIKEHLEYRKENQKLFRQFVITREVKTLFYYFRVDDNLKKWYYTSSKNPINPPIYDFNEIIDYKLTENGSTVSEGGVGRAVTGGLLFGGVGAVVGGVTAGTNKVITNMRFRISFNNKYRNSLDFAIIPTGKECKVGSSTYNMYRRQADSLLSLFDYMCNQANIEKMNNDTKQSNISSADELMKFKELLDKGVINQDEFEAKKKQLLGL